MPLPGRYGHRPCRRPIGPMPLPLPSPSPVRCPCPRRHIDPARGSPSPPRRVPRRARARSSGGRHHDGRDDGGEQLGFERARPLRAASRSRARAPCLCGLLTVSWPSSSAFGASSGSRNPPPPPPPPGPGMLRNTQSHRIIRRIDAQRRRARRGLNDARTTSAAINAACSVLETAGSTRRRVLRPSRSRTARRAAAAPPVKRHAGGRCASIRPMRTASAWRWPARQGDDLRFGDASGAPPARSVNESFDRAWAPSGPGSGRQNSCLSFSVVLP